MRWVCRPAQRILTMRRAATGIPLYFVLRTLYFREAGSGGTLGSLAKARAGPANPWLTSPGGFFTMSPAFEESSSVRNSLHSADGRGEIARDPTGLPDSDG